MGLTQDYESGRKELLAHYAVAPQDFPCSPAYPPATNASLLAAVNAHQQKLGATGVFHANSYVVATGQQPGILTGPLYTVLKGISAIHRAEAFTRSTGMTCMPVFWVASDDHDFEEVRNVHLLTRDQESLTLRYEPETPHTGASMHAMPLSPTLHRLIDTAAAAAVNSEQTPGVVEYLHHSLDASRSVAEWFSRILARMFANTPLVIFSPELPEARGLVRQVFAREIADPLATTRAVNAAGKQLEALGYPAQVRKHDAECSFFLNHENRRCKVLYEDGRFHLPEIGLRITQAEMLRLLEDAPHEFSANVALRPVVQQMLLPVVAYVGGPAEVAYWGQFKRVFERHGLPMPAVLPRASALIMTLRLQKYLSKLGLNPEDFSESPEILLEKVLRGASTPALRAFDREHGVFSRASDALVNAIQAAAPAHSETHQATVQFNRHINDALQRLEAALLRADKLRVETTRKQIERLSAALYPGRVPQERHYCIFSWLFEYGWDLVPRLMKELDAERSTMQEILL